eukprot:6441623-Alexandrium_andersonii.AAC.1
MRTSSADCSSRRRTPRSGRCPPWHLSNDPPLTHDAPRWQQSLVLGVELALGRPEVQQVLRQ